jgi:hypothetical protein
MNPMKTRSIQRLEEKLQHIDDDPLRSQIIENAKQFKTSWVELGRALYTVWKDKHYKGWGFATFDSYTAKEIGIRKQTAMKLLRSYFFLEKEEPAYLRGEWQDSASPKQIPSYESIDVLRLAKSKRDLDGEDYANLKKGIFEEGKDAPSARRDLTSIIRQRQELAPEEAWEKKRSATLRRFITTLKSLKEEARAAKMISAPLIKEADDLIRRLESEIA